MARRHAAKGGIALIVLLMLLAAWPQVAAAQDGGQTNGQDGGSAGKGWVFLSLVSGGEATAETSIWSDAVAPAAIDSTQRWVKPDTYRLVTANLGNLDAVLAQAPAEDPAGVAAGSQTGGQTVLELPLPDGTQQRFAVVESPILAAELAAKYPQIKTYEAYGLDDPTAVARLDRTPAGFHAMILSAGDTVFIDPYLRGNDTLYASYYRADYGNHFGKTRQELEPRPGPSAAEVAAALAGRVRAAQSGPTLRTYRLALAATGEYTQFYGGTVAQALAGMTTTINRVTGLYRRDLGVQFTLIPNTNLLIYTDPNTDPYTDADGSAMLDQNQANIDAVIGSANYDIGHVFSTGGGGIAGLGVVCVPQFKAQGVTGSSSPVGDPFDVDYVAHEIGHQFNGDHTFNNNSVGSCAGNRNSSTAWEPGSGSTIMGYAGICGAQDLQANSDDVFHAGSISQINAFVTAGAGSACGTSTATGNAAPVVNAGPSFTIPRQTPFTLTGTGTDPNGDALTFNWDQLDLGNAWVIDGVLPNTDGDGSARPIFRSQRSGPTPTRTFPALSSILNGSNSNSGEALPAISRVMTFRMTARDGRGGVNDAGTTVTVNSGAGPFLVTAPNSAESWTGGSSQTVTWDVANTTAAPVNCATVNILFSTDGGQTFPTTLAAGTPNDGSQAITVPGGDTTTGRVQVACAGNIFFDINNANISVSGSMPIITLQPSSRIVLIGSNVSFSAAAGGSPTPTVQWQVSTDSGANWTDVPGATTTTLSFTALASDNGKQFQAVFTNVLGTATTNAATLTATTDITPPVITPSVVGTPGNNGWYSGDVSVSWTVSDTESAITGQTGCGAQSVTADTAGVTFTCTATSTGGTGSQQVTIKRDATKPTLAPSVTPDPVTLNLPATATPNAADATSGIAGQSCPAVDTGDLGDKSVTCTATDNAGNTATAEAAYTVIDGSALYLPTLQNQLPTSSRP